MFSKTTMALSTNMPMASARPAMLKTFKVMSKAFMVAKVAITEIGIAVDTITDERMLRKKKSKTKKVISTPSMPVLDRLPRAWLMKSA